jgi:hypothetical protein
MAEALAGQGRQSRRRWVEDAWKKLGGPACLVRGRKPADAQAFFKRLDELDAAGRFALDSLEDDMARLFAAPDAQADGRLQLMTIHKAKGLEFDTVILPGLHRGTRPPDAPLLAWDSFPLAKPASACVAAPVNRRRGAARASRRCMISCSDMERERCRQRGGARAVCRRHARGAPPASAGGRQPQGGRHAGHAGGEFAAGAAVAGGRGGVRRCRRCAGADC